MNLNDDDQKPLLSSDTRKLSFVLESIKKLEKAYPTKDLSRKEIDNGLKLAKSLVIVYESRLNK